MNKLLQRIDKSIAILMLVIGFAFVELYLIATQITENKEKVDDIKLNIQAEYSRREKYDELIAQYIQIEEEGLLDELQSELPRADNFLEVIEELETIAELSNNEIVMSLGAIRLTSEGFEIPAQNGQTAATTTSKGQQVVTIELSTRGDYEALEQFINLFYQSEFYMNLTSMRITKADDGVGNTFLESNFTVQIFVQNVLVSTARP